MGEQQTGSQRTAGQQRGEMQRPAGSQGTGGQQLRGQGLQGRQSFEDHLTNELRIALEDFTELSHVADWCAKMCASEGPELATCAAICRDIAELAAFNEQLIARDSMFGPELADTFIRIATESQTELERFQDRPHVAETMSTIDRTIDSCSTVLETVGGERMEGGQQMQRQQASGQRFRTREMSGGQRRGGQRR